MTVEDEIREAFRAWDQNARVQRTYRRLCWCSLVMGMILGGAIVWAVKG